MKPALLSLGLLAIFISTGLAEDASPPAVKNAWLNKEYTKVIGYRFEPRSPEFSLLTQHGVDTKQLTELTVKSAELTEPQIARLLQATFSATRRTPSAACYNPHHIFVFYSKTGMVLNAIEVCFSCTDIATTPYTDTPKPLWYHHDFAALAHLADELGLWLERRTVAQYEEILEDRDKP